MIKSAAPVKAGRKARSAEQIRDLLGQPGISGRGVLQFVERTRKPKEVMNGLVLRHCIEHRRGGFPMRRDDEDRTRARQSAR